MRTSTGTVVPFATASLNPAGMVMMPTSRPDPSAASAASSLMYLSAKEWCAPSSAPTNRRASGPPSRSTSATGA